MMLEWGAVHWWGVSGRGGIQMKGVGGEGKGVPLLRRGRARWLRRLRAGRWL